MTQSLGRRALIAGLTAAAIAVFAPAVAYADPPSNDDFDNATPITTLPFHTTENTAEATRAADDPNVCQAFAGHTVWFDFTPALDGFVRVTLTGSGFNPGITALTGSRGQLAPVPGFCDIFGGSTVSDTIHVTAGTTYHLLAMSPFGGGGPVTVDLVAVPPAPNDDFAAAQAVTGVPATFFGDLNRAGPEPGEPVPGCAGDAERSLWYTYTPSSTKTVVVAGSFLPVTAYRGDSLAGLTELACGSGQVVFPVVGGQTYHLRVASDAEHADPFTFGIRTAPRIAPGVSTNPQQVSVFDDVEFFPFSGDQLGLPLVSGTVSFGDGVSAPITGETIRHRYAVDGTYQVVVTGSTADGRSGTGTRALTVETHDVTVTTFTVPASARAGQTKPISVTVANTRYDETVQVELLKQNGFFFDSIGALTQSVPARENRTVTFPFAYTYSAADATAGTVTFKVVATLTPFFPGDAHPVDNETQASTTVR